MMADHLIGSEDSEIDVEKLLAEVREKLAQREKPHAARAPSSQWTPFSPPDIIRNGERAKDSFDISTVRSTIRSAEAQADVGETVSPMHQFPTPIRWMALLVGKMVVYLSSFMTDKQRVFNRTVLHVLREITDGLESLKLQLESVKLQNGSVEGEQASIKDVLSNLEKSITDLKSNVSQQEKRLAMLMEVAKRRMPGPFSDE